ncbi:MAG: hypothetical protein U9Q82_03785 [Chloroflexota bacterium]|nr:hypothetical protein [Chloroflexota bacterium]
MKSTLFCETDLRRLAIQSTKVDFASQPRINSMAREYGVPIPAAAVHTQLFNAMLQMGMEELDNSAIVGVIESLADVDLLDE